MYLPRLPTAVISELRNCRSKPGREMPGAIRLRLSSAARMRRPVTTGDNARTTCSTSGSSGILVTGCGAATDELLDLLAHLIHQTVFPCFDVQAQQRFGIRSE